ncbi:thymidylate synthase [Saccharopolyspora rosea]|uniref:thymidylate synthase n=1 Tax=Saccharopolyspora rosea TaxID=524884 RepID=A0ABW3FZI6_9PSEU|nr:thymidylate synthase [Saccharopolyspora rosea]
MRFDTFQDAYLHWLREVFNHPEYRNAPRGFPSRERLAASFTLERPVQRHVTLPSRRTNLVFNYAEVLWYLSGTNSLEQIAHYAPSIAKYSADGRTLAGTAYGPRIFSHGRGRIDQWQQVLSTLREDPDSKRAVVQIFDPAELAVPDNIDVACTLALQFFIRAGRLHGVGYMRANDAFRGMVSDVFSFTFLQEFLARQLGLRVGRYVHNVGSLHVYAHDDDWARRVLAEAAATGLRRQRFPELPKGDNWPHLRAVLDVEKSLRHNEFGLHENRDALVGLPEYWRQVLLLFEAYRQVRYEDGLAHRTLDGMWPVFRDSVRNRWPAHLAGQVRDHDIVGGRTQ